ncbi:MAG: nucleotidyl transferase AbiEii/AbiGii toxin family protein [Christensenellaceae bacterium]|jgi:hypothetical protein|nr:nucleotidyl transferase AbiEii/AbiGii toxin family protein [Christensenellaceae bacterium]
MKNAQQLVALLNNKSKELGVSGTILLNRYFMEKLLERIAMSKYNSNFILKGGILISSLIGLNARTTQDIDISIKNIPLTRAKLTEVMQEVCAVNNDDGIAFAFQNITDIQKDAEYPGLRVSFEYRFENIHNVIHIDIATGDVIVPSEIRFGLDLCQAIRHKKME